MRKVIQLNQGWAFLKGQTKGDKVPKKGKRNWEKVDLPHTWNRMDGQDGGSDFYRAKCWYCKEIAPDLKPGELAFLELQGANAIAEVYVNGEYAGGHQGGFSTFYVEITPYLKRGKARLSISVDNRANDVVYPQTADFTFFGGLYRDVKLVVVPASHFAFTDGSSGLKVTPVLNEDGTADVTLEAEVSGGASNQRVLFQLNDLGADATALEGCATIHLEDPHLWNGRQDPYLYIAEAVLVQGDRELDRVSVRCGIRSFRFDPEKGFFLNGVSYPLHGVSRHQDRLDMGWAITPTEHKEDMELIAETGANTIRLAHYQHDQYFYDLCDEYGMVVWAEIPFISVLMDGERAKENTLTQMRELVQQNYNHPSIVCWGIANEITIGGESEALLANLHALNDLCHALDHTRATTLANLTMVPNDSPLNFITDILSYNHYFGWYMGDVADNGPWLDQFHVENPERVLGLSEYGCEGILAYHNDTPKVQDYSEEYQAFYHEKMLETFAERPYLWSTHVWNMFDFASDMRDEGGVKGRNHKGLVTYDRKTKKDAFYIYKAWWSDEPFVHICSRRFQERCAEKIDIKVYTNQPRVTILLNGKEFAEKDARKVVVFENVPLLKGTNAIEAVSGKQRDYVTFDRVETPNESYVLRTQKEGINVANWFDGMETHGEMQYPEGYFSIRDKIGDIMKVPEGALFINEMIDKISESMNMTISKGMLGMAKNFTVERLFEMAGDRVPGEIKPLVNQKLNEIQKK